MLTRTNCRKLLFLVMIPLIWLMWISWRMALFPIKSLISLLSVNMSGVFSMMASFRHFKVIILASASAIISSLFALCWFARFPTITVSAELIRRIAGRCVHLMITYVSNGLARLSWTNSGRFWVRCSFWLDRKSFLRRSDKFGLLQDSHSLSRTFWMHVNSIGIASVNNWLSLPLYSRLKFQLFDLLWDFWNFMIVDL